jgi:pectate lyase/pectin methylesterase-like acyl-CoA thioesterase
MKTTTRNRSILLVKPFNLLASGFFLLLLLFCAASPASAAITFDSSSSSAVAVGARSITWRHTIGGGPDRALVVAVAIDDFIIFNGDIATVKFNNVVMHAAPNSHAMSPGLRILETQIFYLTGDELPQAGSYEVSVSFTRKVDVAAGGAVSLFGVQPGAPALAATNVKPISLGPIRTTINAPADSWVVDIVASEINANPMPGAGQIKRFGASRNLFGVAGSAQAATMPGPTTLVWNNGLSRLVTSAVAFAARPEFRLTLSTTGSGTIQSDPAGDKFPAGTRVTLTAAPAPGWRFEGWSGDLTGTDNPAIITMDREKSITANFTPLPPGITTQPLSQTVTTGSNVTFTVAANGEPPLTYQWKKNGVEIAGATTDTLALSNVQLADAGIYTVTVSNAGGSIGSAPATLSVTSAAGQTIMNDSFADGERLTFAPPASATWLKAQSSTVTTVAPGSARFTWNTTSADMISGIFTSAGSPVTLGVGDTLNLSVTFSFTGLNPDAIAAPSPGLRFGILDSKSSRPADNGNTSNAVYIGDTGYGLFTSISTAGATSGSAFTLNRRTTITTNNIFNTGADFTTIGAGGGPARAFADNTDYTLTYSITRLSATQTRLAASITGGALGDAYNFSTVETSATPETTFDYFGWRVGSSNFAASVTFKNLSVTLGLTPPAIATQPVGKTTIEGDNIVLMAAASGSAPLSFQWSKNGVPIAGATGPTLTLNNVRVADSGAYVFTATNPAGVVASDVAAVVVNLAPPVITMQPRSQIILVGEPVTFTVVAGGSAPLAYQWRKNGADIAGATAPLFSIASLRFSDEGVYTVVVSNGAGSVVSDPATLVVSATPVPPSIITQPTSITVVAGAQAQFTVNAEGSSPLSFQWRKDGVAIPGATAATYTIAGASADDAGSYTVTVTNAAGSVTSDPATLTVITPPSIVTPPASQTVNAGATATFTVVASGTQPLTYQWRKNGANIPSATTDTLTFNNVQAADAAAYSVVVSNAAGSVTSPAATLTVVDPALTVTALFPANGATGLPVDAPLKITFGVAPTPGASGLIQIHDAATGGVIDTIDLAASAQLKMIGGALYNYLPVIVSGNTALITPHAALEYNKTYFVTIDTGVFRTANGVFAGIASDAAWRFTTKPAAPDAGATTLVVAADGAGDFATVQGAIDFVPAANGTRRIIFVRKGVYQELVRINGAKPLITLRGEDRKETVIAYANNANFNPNSRSVVWVDAGDWTVENLTVRNLTPQGGSQAETIRTNAARSQIRNCDLFSFQDTLQLNGSAYVENCYIEGDVDFMWGNAAAYFLNCELKNVRTGGFYVQARTPQNQPGFIYVNCRLSGATGVTGTFLARIDPNIFPDSQVVYINSAMGPQVAPAGWLLNNATSSNTVRFWEYRSTDLNGAALDVSQRIASSRQISDAEATQLSDTNFVLGGWAPLTPPFIRSQPLSQTASAGQDVAFAVGASGVPAPTYQWFKDGAAIPGATGPTLLLPAVQAGAAGNYTVAVSNSVGSSISATATLAVVAEAGAPAITQQPQPQTAVIGDAATFTVVATGAATLAYQWMKDGMPIAGATGPTLTRTALQLSDAGFYSVTISNGIGSATSAPAVLAVRATPIVTPVTIVTQPVSRTAFVGDAVSFSVMAQGVPPPSYQWLKDGAPIAGATAATLTLTNVQLNSAGSYSVTVTNVSGSVTSNPATLTVFTRGNLIAQQPQSQVVNIGETATFTVVANGAGAISYQWRKNGVDIAGATDSALTLPNVQPTDTAVYTALVVSGTEASLSAPAILAVTSQATGLPPLATFALEGFATMGQGVTGGGLVDPSDTARYKVIDSSTPNPAQTLQSYLQSPDPLIIELRADVDLGALNNQNRRPLINPELIASNLGVIRVASNKTLFSDRGATLRHGTLNIDGSQNIIIRNLKFRGLWEWDDATQGAYDLQGWDFIALTNGARNVWIDHCDFAKVYDGQVDIVRGSDLVTLSYCRFTGDLGDEAANQINYLESLFQANPADPRISYYASLRNAGQSVQQIITHEIPQDKTSLVGNDDNAGATDAGRLNVTYHHNAFTLVRQRTPRMRFGNAHVYNILVDDTLSAPFPGTQTAVNSTINAAVLVENSDFLEVRTPLAFSGGGRITQRGSQWTFNGALTPFNPAQLNPVDPNALVWNPPASFTWTDLTRLPYPYLLSPVDFVRNNPNQIGTITPADDADRALLRGYLPLTSLLANAGFTLSLSTQGQGTIQSIPSGPSYQAGTIVQLTAVPAAGWQFSNWSGDLTGSANPATIVMNSPKSVTAIFTEALTPPSITTQPVSQTAPVGSNVTFNVVATGTAPLTYQWKKDGADIPGATGATLSLTNVQPSDAGSYSVVVSNSLGAVTSDPATLTVTTGPTFLMRERFADGDRTTQILPDSAAWFTSSGSNNLTAIVGQATQIVSSSRTLLAYFTNATETPVNLGVNQTLTLDFTVQFTGFDTAAAPGANTFVVGLLRSVANPDATSGTGFIATGPPNTNARVNGDFGSNNPTTNAFNNYGGYAAMTYTGLEFGAPVRLYARTGTSASLLNSTSPFTQFTGAAPTPSTAMITNTDYRGTLTLQNTGGGVNVSYTLRDAATGNVVMNYSATQAAASFTQFDTAAFFLSKNSASPNYNFIIKSVDVSLAGSN